MGTRLQRYAQHCGQVTGHRSPFFDMGALGFDVDVEAIAACRGPRLASLNIRDKTIKANTDLALAA